MGMRGSGTPVHLGWPPGRQGVLVPHNLPPGPPVTPQLGRVGEAAFEGMKHCGRRVRSHLREGLALVRVGMKSPQALNLNAALGTLPPALPPSPVLSCDLTSLRWRSQGFLGATVAAGSGVSAS